MYLIGDFFVQVSLQNTGGRWTALARFSRKFDYLLHGDVSSVVCSAPVSGVDRWHAEQAALVWARTVVESRASHLESLLVESAAARH